LSYHHYVEVQQKLAITERAISGGGKKMRSVLSAIASVVVLTVGSAMGQSTLGSIVGVVHDKTQAVIPGATVKIKNLEDSSVRSATSDQNGTFEFLNLKPGGYLVSVNAEGFADFQIATAELSVRQVLRIDATLEVKSPDPDDRSL
jgi:uncharacterized surface anchored protein